jgi:hypothetical protein
LTREREQLSSDRASSLDVRDDLVEVDADWMTFVHLQESELAVPPDRGQEVIEVVGDTGGELANGLEPLALRELGIHRVLPGDVAYVEHRANIATFRG